LEKKEERTLVGLSLVMIEMSSHRETNPNRSI